MDPIFNECTLCNELKKENYDMRLEIEALKTYNASIDTKQSFVVINYLQILSYVIFVQVKILLLKTNL